MNISAAEPHGPWCECSDCDWRMRDIAPVESFTGFYKHRRSFWGAYVLQIQIEITWGEWIASDMVLIERSRIIWRDFGAADIGRIPEMMLGNAAQNSKRSHLRPVQGGSD